MMIVIIIVVVVVVVAAAVASTTIATRTYAHLNFDCVYAVCVYLI